jgi:hypothetical protein
LINRFKPSLSAFYVTFLILLRHIDKYKISNQKPKTSQEHKKIKAMKTSIIVSTFAALTLMVTLVEVPTHRNAENNIVTSVSNYSYLPASLVSAEPAMKSSASARKESTVKTSLPSAEDLSYLKFDVANYLNDEHMATEVNNENSLEYLKFDVNEYTPSDETASYESIELPVNEFDYLKFDVNDYTSTNETVSDESIELPVNEFNYLKFDVNDYTSTNETVSDESIELPVNEFNYLKFDVNDYTSSDEAASYESIELPVNEFEYLKFDVSKYSNENHVIIGELPVAE